MTDGRSADADLLVTREAGVLRITLNRPDRRNALTAAMVDAIGEALESGHTRIVVDLSATTFLDSTALGVLIGAVTLSGPHGADNVDPWRTVTDSLTWSP